MSADVLTAAVAMSGGVDSAVTALLMQEAGYRCTGVTMHLYRDGDEKPSADGTEDGTTSPELEAARTVARTLGIPHRVIPLEATFCRSVIDPFVAAYRAGLTPNPCVVCNKVLKFGVLLDKAREYGADVFATGHYARVCRDHGGRYLLRRAADEGKDQSYVLWSLSQDVLSRVCLPLGEYTKNEVRELAQAHGFVNAHAHDSQDICFIPDGDYVSFLRRYANLPDEPGQFVDRDGKVLGNHRGMIAYTVGQRKGLGIALGHPVYVLGKDAATGRVTLGENEQLFSRTLRVRGLNWIAFDRPGDGVLSCTARIRYSHKAAPCTVELTDADEARVTFSELQRAVTPGQSAVFYDGDVVLGGGVII